MNSEKFSKKAAIITSAINLAIFIIGIVLLKKFLPLIGQLILFFVGISYYFFIREKIHKSTAKKINKNAGLGIKTKTLDNYFSFVYILWGFFLIFLTVVLLFVPLLAILFSSS
jgi:hypothetical protein